MFRKTSKGLIEAAPQILSRFPDLVDPNQPTESADPYVVALALKEKSDEVFFPPDNRRRDRGEVRRR